MFNCRGLNNKSSDLPILSVSINTDDQGVFDTYIKNEYALIALALEKEMKESKSYEVEDIYEYLDYIRKQGFEQAFKYNREGYTMLIKNDLIENIEKIHTTELGVVRIKRNLNLANDDVVVWCVNKILDKSSIIIRKGKNWYVDTGDCTITVNAHSYTIITAHKNK